VTLCKGIGNVLWPLMLISLIACMQQPIKPTDSISLDGRGIDAQGMSLSYGMVKKYLLIGHTLKILET
jgi:hypothetical protein